MDILNYIDKMQIMYGDKDPSSMDQEPRNMADGERTGFKKGLSAKQTNLFNSAKEFYKNTDANIKSDIRKNIITKATVGSRKKAAVLIKKENLINLTEMGDILDIKENIPAERGTPTSGFRSKIVEAMTRKDSRLSPSKETFLNDYLIKKLKLQKINVGQGKPTYFIKKPNAAEIKDIKKYFIGKSGNFEPVVENRVRLFHSDPVLNKYAKKGLFLPQTTEMSEYLKKKGMTYNQAAYAQNKLTQIYNGGQNSNYLLKDIGINRVAANTFFRATANLPFNNPYRQLQYRDAMETITKEIGPDYFGKKGSMLNFKNKARLILKEAGIPIYDAKKGKKAFGINLNELTGVTAASRTGTSPYSQFFNLAEGKFNLGRYAQFNRTFEEFQNKLDNEINKGKKGNPNQIIKDYNIKRNSLLKEYNFLKENDVPKLSLKDPTKIYGKKRIAELKAQGLDLDENFKTKKYTIDVGKKTPTIKEFNINPEVQKTQINIGKNIEKNLLKLAGTVDPDCRTNAVNGGRIGFKLGSGSNRCLAVAKKASEELIKSGKGSTVQKSLLQKIVAGGNSILKNTGSFVKGALNPVDFFRLKNLIGAPAAIAAVAVDTVSIFDDMVRKGQPFDVAAGNEFLTQFLDLNTESKQAQRILDDKGSDLSPAAKQYAQGLVDIGKYENLEKEKRNLIGLTEGQARPEDLEEINKQLKVLEEKFKTFREDGALDYNAAVNELGINEEQSEYIGEPKKAGMFYYAADDESKDGFYRNADGDRIKVNEYGYATKGNIFDIPSKTGARVDRKLPYGETDQGRNPALLTEGEKIFRAETKQPAKYQKPFTYKDFNYQSKALSDEQYAKALKYYQDQGFIKPGQKLEDVNIPKGYNTRIVNGKEYDPPKTFLQDTTEFFNIGDKWKQALYQPGMLGANQKFAGGGIAGLSGGDKSGRPPESGPASQGLRSLFNNGKKR